MAGTTILQPSQPKQERVKLRGFLGGTFENLGDIFNTATATITGLGEGYVNEGPVRDNDLENLSKMPDLKTGSKFPTIGELSGFQTPRTVEKTDEQLLLEQRAAVVEAESILRQSRAESITQEEIRYEVAGMSEEDRNRRLKLNTSLRKKHTEDAYHMTELYRQAKEEVSAIKQRKEDTKIPSPAKQPSALEGAFEGRSGNQGGGKANLSAQAVG